MIYIKTAGDWWERICKIMCIYSNNKCMCVFLISPVPIAEPLTSELIDTPVFHNLAPRPIKYRVSVPIPSYIIIKCPLNHMIMSNITLIMCFYVKLVQMINFSTYDSLWADDDRPTQFCNELRTRSSKFVICCTKWFKHNFNDISLIRI